VLKVEIQKDVYSTIVKKLILLIVITSIAYAIVGALLSTAIDIAIANNGTSPNIPITLISFTLIIIGFSACAIQTTTKSLLKLCRLLLLQKDEEIKKLYYKCPKGGDAL